MLKNGSKIILKEQSKVYKKVYKNNLFNKRSSLCSASISVVGNTLRFLPPLTITKGEIDEGFNSLSLAVSSL